MKQISSYILSMVFIFATHSKSLDYIFKTISGDYISLKKDFCSEEEESEEEENETDNSIDKLFASNDLSINILEHSFLHFFVKNNFYFSEYYKIIYSPPKFI